LAVESKLLGRADVEMETVVEKLVKVMPSEVKEVKPVEVRTFLEPKKEDK